MNGDYLPTQYYPIYVFNERRVVELNFHMLYMSFVVNLTALSVHKICFKGKEVCLIFSEYQLSVVSISVLLLHIILKTCYDGRSSYCCCYRIDVLM
jgi:hypothetical protein